MISSLDSVPFVALRLPFNATSNSALLTFLFSAFALSSNAAIAPIQFFLDLPGGLGTIFSHSRGPTFTGGPAFDVSSGSSLTGPSTCAAGSISSASASASAASLSVGCSTSRPRRWTPPRCSCCRSTNSCLLGYGAGPFFFPPSSNHF